MYPDVVDPTLYPTYEAWESQADPDVQLAGARVVQLIGAVGDLPATPPAIVAQEVLVMKQLL